MLLGIVIGSVWCTRKAEALTGQTFLLVAPEGHQGPALVCADQAGMRKATRRTPWDFRRTVTVLFAG